MTKTAGQGDRIPELMSAEATDLNDNDETYLNLILEPIRLCAQYQPKFGQGHRSKGLTFADFQNLYKTDPFYDWFGLDHPMVYAAHNVSGGLTSIYRQIGAGCERLFRTILCDTLGLSETDVAWSYEVR